MPAAASESNLSRSAGAPLKSVTTCCFSNPQKSLKIPCSKFRSFSTYFNGLKFPLAVLLPTSTAYRSAQAFEYRRRTGVRIKKSCSLVAPVSMDRTYLIAVQFAGNPLIESRDRDRSNEACAAFVIAGQYRGFSEKTPTKSSLPIYVSRRMLCGKGTSCPGSNEIELSPCEG